MNIIHMTAGTATFYCGNCVRDNAMVKSMQRQGHEVLMVPLYLPLYPDESNTAQDSEIFFGGINVYLQQKLSVFRYTPRWIDKLFDSKLLLNMAGKMMGMTKATELGELTLSMLKGEDGNQKKELDRLIEWLKTRPKPDIISLSNGLLAGFAKPLKDALNTKVVCHLQGEDGFLDTLPPPYNNDSWDELSRQLQHCDGIIAVSNYYADLMKKKVGNDEKFKVVLNGISLEGYSNDRMEPEVRCIGYLARMCADKGLHTLVDAFIQLKKDNAYDDVKLKVAGVKLPQDEPFVAEQKDKLTKSGIIGDVSFHPNVSREEKIAFLESLTVFSVPALYGEAFGLYVIEALAAGVPVVQPEHGGFTEIIEITQGGQLFDHEVHHGYVETLKSLLDQPEHRQHLSAKGKEVVHTQFSIDAMTSKLIKIYETI